MRLLQHIISSCFRKSRSILSLKNVQRDLSYLGYSHCLRTNSKLLAYYSFPAVCKVNRIHTIQCLYAANEDSPVPPSKKRLQRRRTVKYKTDTKEEICSAVAYSSAEQYKIQELARALENQGTYIIKPLPEDAENVLHVSTVQGLKESSHIYFFSEGSVVFWNIPAAEQWKILNFLKPYETNSYDAELITDEKEDLDYIYSEEPTSIYDDTIVLNSNTDADLYTYTFSNSLALSVKLGVLEASLEKFCDSIEWVTEKMKKGEKIAMSRNEIFVKRGELFALRHVINLSSDYLDTPDFYWDRKDLEILYKKTCNYLDIAKRTKTMNERLSYCSELIDLLGNHMNDEHHVRLEWMIIILIMVEIQKLFRHSTWYQKTYIKILLRLVQ